METINEKKIHYRIILMKDGNQSYVRSIRGDQVITTEDPSKARKYRSIDYIFGTYVDKIKKRVQGPAQIQLEKITVQSSIIKQKSDLILGYTGEES
jgi:hypothetical protein